MNPPPAENRYLKQGTPPCTAGDPIKMNIVTPFALKPNSLHEPPIFPIHAFIETHQGALQNAAYLLSGSAGASLVNNITDTLSREWVPSRRTIGLLSDLKNILFLEHVDDPDRIESGCFAAIDPTDPVVEEICLLADGLAEALRTVSNASAQGGCATVTKGAERSPYYAGAQELGDL